MIEISILDTKSANFHSVKKAVDKYNPKNEITSNIDTIEKSNGLIIPGVSTTDTVLSNIKQLGLEETIKNFYNSGKP
ncbi:MAG: imidazole glycerol phosphate synthase subunit HisH, partial [SAR202 cluster bacterium]|nr:imidazole glycerol phosphate synthase subunit HisH [SAR202 cluster bacterium]